MAASGTGNSNTGSVTRGWQNGRRTRVARLLLALGLGLAGVAGMWVGRAWSEGTVASWVMGLSSLACGTIIAVVGMRRTTVPREPRQYRAPAELAAPREQREQAIPLLGELLVHKYHVISSKQLQEALAEQRDRGGPLGQILVAMRLVEYEQIAEALEDQLTYGDPRRGSVTRLRAETTMPSVPPEAK